MTELVNVNYTEHPRSYFDSGIWGRMRRIALSQEGNVVGVHDKNNTNLWEDQSPVDWTEYESNGWNCMVQIPIFYYRTHIGTYKEYQDVYRLEVRDLPKEGFKHHPAFEREDGVVENYQYFSAFEGWFDSLGRMRSLPNKEVTVSITRAQARDAAKKNGMHEYYSQQDFYLTSAVQMLYLSEYGDFNSQKMIATGGTSGNTGRSLVDGNSSGGNNLYMTYRGIENFHNNLYKWVDGMNIQNYNVFVSKGDFADDVFAGSYKKVATVPAGSNYISNFHKLEGEFDFTFIPSDITDGSSDSYLADYLYTTTGNRIAAFGSFGASVDGGAFGWALRRAGGSMVASYAARLQYLKS